MGGSFCIEWWRKQIKKQKNKNARTIGGWKPSKWNSTERQLNVRGGLLCLATPLLRTYIYFHLIFRHVSIQRCTVLWSNGIPHVDMLNSTTLVSLLIVWLLTLFVDYMVQVRGFSYKIGEIWPNLNYILKNDKIYRACFIRNVTIWWRRID
jgi:hypothetical protein